MNSKEHIQTFDKELDFEVALCEVLKQHGWEKDVIMNPTEEELVDNWAKIIHSMNQEQDKLGQYGWWREEIWKLLIKDSKIFKSFYQTTSVLRLFKEPR